MNDALLQQALNKLSSIQRRAVDWDDGAILVLAGPGTGKTRVLTCRIARILDSSRDKKFRILALTFTNKAAHEMSERVTTLANGSTRRTYMGTFHGFCAQVLRQHGVHLGIKPNFAIYARRADREGVLEDALRRNGEAYSAEDMRLLPLIDDLKSKLIAPDQALQSGMILKDMPRNNAQRAVHTYRLYEEELHRANALDFNSLILRAYQLFSFQAIVRHYQSVYRYWLIDEFQDTGVAHYKLLRRMAGEEFRNIFAVADDDQTIYEWNGANISRISDLIRDYSCCVLQMPISYRCPPTIVAAANRLLFYNARRIGSKQPTVAFRGESDSNNGPIQIRVFDTDTKELEGISKEIAKMDTDMRKQTIVLARTRALVEAMSMSLDQLNVSSTTIARRDAFLSPEMRWLVACLNQIRRPLDRRNMRKLVDTFAGFAESSIDYSEIESRSAAGEVAPLTIWLEATLRSECGSSQERIIQVIADLAGGKLQLNPGIGQILSHWSRNDERPDLKDDLSAWRRAMREISASARHGSLNQLLQSLELRSKDPIPIPGSVNLATIYGAKGLEFDTVYLIGMAEEILPSWYSVNNGNGSAAIEEERRSCFVAMTRASKNLILSRAKCYKGHPKDPSRFLQEMGLP